VILQPFFTPPYIHSIILTEGWRWTEEDCSGERGQEKREGGVTGRGKGERIPAK